MGKGKFFSSFLLAFLAAPFVACNNLGSNTPAPRTFLLSLSPTSLTVQQGAQGQTTLTLTPRNGFQAPFLSPS